MGISALASRLGLAKSTVHRLATTLVEYDILEQNRETGKYRLGLALFELSATFAPSGRASIRTGTGAAGFRSLPESTTVTAPRLAGDARRGWRRAHFRARSVSDGSGACKELVGSLRIATDEECDQAGSFECVELRCSVCVVDPRYGSFEPLRRVSKVAGAEPETTESGAEL